MKAVFNRLQECFHVAPVRFGIVVLIFHGGKIRISSYDINMPSRKEKKQFMGHMLANNSQRFPFFLTIIVVLLFLNVMKFTNVMVLIPC